MYANVVDTSVTRTLGLALRTLGSRERLAEHLGVSAERLDEWLDGRQEPPIEAYLRALDLVARGPFA